MATLLLMSVCMPAFLVLVAAMRSRRALCAIAPLFFWAQVASVAYALWPLLSGASDKLVLSSDLTVDRLAAAFALLTQIVVACAVTHAQVFFRREDESGESNLSSVRLFYVATSLFLLAMTAVFVCDNLGLMWIAVEATTLCSAPLVYYHRTKHSLEAAWKYLIICSVGIAFALFGSILIFAASQGAGTTASLNLAVLLKEARALHYPLLRLGFLFCLLGYGTKAGIFPLHSWLPDAHSEAPAPASAMLSGGLLNCALFAIWKLSVLLVAAGHGQLVVNAGLGLGSATVVAASLFLVHQHGLKRLFAYSSIENVGLMLTAIGLGSGWLFFLLAVNHSAAKVALFLLSGNVIQSTGTKALSEIRGILAINPVWATAMIAGCFAVTGSPPFGAFLAEWQLLTAGSALNLWPLVAALLLSLALSFLAVLGHIGKIVCGTPRSQAVAFQPVASSLVPAALVVVALATGITQFAVFCR